MSGHQRPAFSRGGHAGQITVADAEEARLAREHALAASPEGRQVSEALTRAGVLHSLSLDGSHVIVSASALLALLTKPPARWR